VAGKQIVLTSGMDFVICLQEMATRTTEKHCVSHAFVCQTIYMQTGIPFHLISGHNTTEVPRTEWTSNPIAVLS
jgi:hypothetical protein